MRRSLVGAGDDPGSLCPRGDQDALADGAEQTWCKETIVEPAHLGPHNRAEVGARPHETVHLVYDDP